MSSGSYRQVLVQCPFYLYDDGAGRICCEVEALSESVRDGYVSAPDLIRVLRDEYEIDIIGG